MTAMSNPCRLLMGRLWRLWRLVEVEEVLDGEVGQAPQLNVRAGAVARRHQPPVVDRVAPQLGMSQSGTVHRGQDAVECIGPCPGQAREQDVHIPAPYDGRPRV